MKKTVEVPNFNPQTGLVTVIVVKKMQETLGLPGGIILMVAHANAEAFRLTLETGYAHFWSRSRKKIWKKGETSGNLIPVCELRMDCDCDTVIYYTNVSLSGLAACHLGTVSCFSKVPDVERNPPPKYKQFEVHSNFCE